jgi:hypothetical protein
VLLLADIGPPKMAPIEIGLIGVMVFLTAVAIVFGVRTLRKMNDDPAGRPPEGQL